MTDDEAEHRYSIMAEAREKIARLADLKVEYRDHDEDGGYLTPWSRGMSPKPRTLSISEVDARIAAAIKRHTETWIEIVALALHHDRKLHRAEIEKLRAETVDGFAWQDGDVIFDEEQPERRANQGKVLDMPTLPRSARRG